MPDQTDLRLQTLEAEAQAVALAIHCWDSKAVMDALAHLLDRAISCMPPKAQLGAYEFQILGIKLAWAIHLGQQDVVGQVLTILDKKIKERFGEAGQGPGSSPGRWQSVNLVYFWWKDDDALPSS